jgi:hypothetical protein
MQCTPRAPPWLAAGAAAGQRVIGSRFRFGFEARAESR